MTRIVATWSPCCDQLSLDEVEAEFMHTERCRKFHRGVLGPTMRLVVHPDDVAELERYEEGE